MTQKTIRKNMFKLILFTNEKKNSNKEVAMCTVTHFLMTKSQIKKKLHFKDSTIDLFIKFLNSEQE